MLEQEIKLHVPAASRKAVAAQLTALPGPRRMRLRAMYFDTADRRLARQYAAIRLRQEGRRWVQTFKMAGSDSLSRIEINHSRPGPELDLSVYAGTPAQAVIDKADGELVLRYETDVLRLTRHVRTRLGLVEVAYDMGTIRAGALEVPINEVEFERVSGQVGALFALAGRWLRQHELVLDGRSKAERGDALANADVQVKAASPAEQPAVREAEIERYWAPARAGKIRLDDRSAPSEALASISSACYDQIVRNAAMLAEVDTARLDVRAGAEHVHQLRVGMRRLRSAWRLFRGWAPLPGAELQEGARYYFGGFGTGRDADVLGATVVPALLRAGMPPIALAHGDGGDAARLATSPEFQRWQLDLLAWTVELSARQTPSTERHAVRRPALRRLRKWHRRILADGQHFAKLDDAARHQLRKRAKRLRYGLSFIESLLPPRSVKRYKKRLAALQDVLGEINDLVVARERYAGMTASEPQAWFALGWIAARLDTLYLGAQAAIAALDDAKPFWR